MKRLFSLGAIESILIGIAVLLGQEGIDWKLVEAELEQWRRRN